MIAATVIAEVVSILHAANSADLVGFTESELYDYLNRALETMHSKANFLTQSVDVPAHSNATYAMAADAVSLIDVAWNGRSLTLRTAAQMDSDGDGWEAKIDDEPLFVIYEHEGPKTFRLSPAPASSGALTVVYRAVAPPMSSGSGIAVPECVDVISTLRTVESANGKDGLWQFPESAGFAGALADLVESAAGVYYGGAV